MSSENKYKKRTSFWPTIISMTFVLFFVGLIGLLAIFSKSLTEYYNNNFEIYVYCLPEANDSAAKLVLNQLRASQYTQEAIFEHKDESAKKEIEKTGTDFIKTLGYNPFPHSIKVIMKSEFVEDLKLKKIEQEWLRITNVDDIIYAKDDLGKNLLGEIKKNFNSIGKILIFLSIFLLFIAIILINNTVRLNMFARRFLIKSMQYVGASDWFIIKPFIGMYIGYALIATLFSWILLRTGVYFIQKELFISLFPNFFKEFLFLGIFLLILSLLIVLISVIISTKKYLKLKIDQLY